MQKAINFVQGEELMGESIMRFLRSLPAEKKTDELIDAFLEKVDVPWVPDWIVRKVLDKFLPDTLFDLLEILLRKVGQLPSERQSHPANPGF